MITSHKLCKTKKISQAGSYKVLIALCVVKQKYEKKFKRKNAKVTKRALAFKGYTSSCNVDNTVNSFNFEQQF